METNQQNDKAAHAKVNASEGSNEKNRMNPVSNPSNIGNTGMQSEQSGNDNQNSHQGSSQAGQSGMHNQSTYNGNPTHNSAGQPYNETEGRADDSNDENTDEGGEYTSDHRNAAEKSGSFRNQHPGVTAEKNGENARSEQGGSDTSQAGERNAESARRTNRPTEGTL